MIDFLLHFDQHLLEFVTAYGSVGLRDSCSSSSSPKPASSSRRFCRAIRCCSPTGALCATGALSTPLAFALLVVAAFAGDAVNYSIGRADRPARVHRRRAAPALFHRLLNRDHLDRAHEFFEQYGGKAVILGRFVPIVRTFVPFVAGAAQMTRHTFVLYNIVGAIGWVGLCLGAGLLFGNVPIVKEQLLAGDHRHRLRVGAADGVRVSCLTEERAGRAVG